MRIRENGPSFGEPLEDEFAEVSTTGGTASEEMPRLDDPSGAYDGAFSDSTRNSTGDYEHEDSDTKIPIRFRKIIEKDLNTNTRNSNRNKQRNRYEKRNPTVEVDSTHIDNTVEKGDIRFAKTESGEVPPQEALQLIRDISDFLDEKGYISTELYSTAQILNNSSVNRFLLLLPDDTIVHLDETANINTTIGNIKDRKDSKKSSSGGKIIGHTSSDVNDTELTKILGFKIDGPDTPKRASKPVFKPSVRSSRNRPAPEQIKTKDVKTIGRPTDFMEHMTPHNASSLMEESNADPFAEKTYVEHIIKSPVGVPVDIVNSPTPNKKTTPSIIPKQETLKQRGEIHLENLLKVANTKEDLIAIINQSDDLNEGLWGTQQTYSREELVALVDATWNGEVGIDHLPRTAGFREAVDRVREKEREKNMKIAKQHTAAELDPLMRATIEVEDTLKIPREEKIYDLNTVDESFIYNYTVPKLSTREALNERIKNTSIFGKIWKKLTGKK